MTFSAASHQPSEEQRINLNSNVKDQREKVSSLGHTACNMPWSQGCLALVLSLSPCCLTGFRKGGQRRMSPYSLSNVSKKG